MVYKYRATRYSIPAQVAGEYLHELSEKENGVTAERVLDVSRPDDALLHEVFEWDDSVAAEAYRLRQSREFIGNIVVVQADSKPVEPVRAFISVTDTAHSERGVFKPVMQALNHEAERDIVLSNALRELNIFKEKYRRLSELKPVFEAIDSLNV